MSASRTVLVLGDAKRATAENDKMTDCYFGKRDWRLCTKEVGLTYFKSSPSLQ